MMRKGSSLIYRVNHNLIMICVVVFVLVCSMKARADSTVLVYDPESRQLLPLWFVLYGEIPVDAVGDVSKGGPNVPDAAVGSDSNRTERRDKDVQTSIRRLTGQGYRHPKWILDSSPRGAIIVGLPRGLTAVTPQEVWNLPNELVDGLVLTNPQHGQCRYVAEDKQKLELNQKEYFYISCKLQTMSN